MTSGNVAFDPAVAHYSSCIERGNSYITGFLMALSCCNFTSLKTLKTIKIRNMEKLRFAVQILVLVLAFPLLFLIEMNGAGNTNAHVEENNSDSIQVKKAPVSNAENTTGDFNAKTAGYNRLMLFSN
jgi:hypothetical protein